MGLGLRPVPGRGQHRQGPEALPQVQALLPVHPAHSDSGHSDYRTDLKHRAVKPGFTAWFFAKQDYF